MNLDLRSAAGLLGVVVGAVLIAPASTGTAAAVPSSFVVGDGPSRIGFDESSGRAYVGLAYERAVAVIDTATRTPVGTVRNLGVDDLEVNPVTGDAFVGGDHTVTRIQASALAGDVAAPPPLATLPFRVTRLSVAAELGRVFVAGSDYVEDGDSGYFEHFLASLDMTSGALVHVVVTPGFLQDLTVHPERGSVYASSNGGVDVFDATTLEALGTVPGTAGALELALDRSRERLHVTQQGLDAPVLVVDTSTREVDPGGSLPGAHDAMALAVDPQRDSVWVARLWGTAPEGGVRGTVDQWTSGAEQPVTTAVGTQPRALAVRPSTGEVWVADEVDDTVTVIGTTAAGPEPGSLQTTVSGGETVSTGSEATADVPVQTSIVVPVGAAGTLSVAPQDTTTFDPSGFTLFGTELVLEGPTATVEAPYEVAFTVDASVLGGVQPADVQVFRNGVAVGDCTDPVAAVPDPCVESRGPAGEAQDDAQITVRTSRFSTWSIGRLSYDLNGPLAPVDPAPVVNTAKTGAVIPVKFTLGGDRGTDVFAVTPRVLARSCTSSATDEASGTAASSASADLTFDSSSGQYVFTWKTDSSMKGCRTLVLSYRDGSELRMSFTLR